MSRLLAICTYICVCTIATSSAASILIVRPTNKEFAVVSKKIQEVVKYDYPDLKVVEAVISEPDQLKSVDLSDVLLVVAFDNQMISLVEKMRGDRAYSLIGVMGLNLKKILAGYGSGGLVFETPPLMVLERFSRFAKNRLDKVVTFYRASQFDQLISDAVTQLKREKIDLHAVDVDPHKADLDAFLYRSIKKYAADPDVDAFLVLPDSALITKDNIFTVWKKAATESKKPFLCTLENLAATHLGLCAVAVSPNLERHGEQIAELVFTALEGNGSKIEYVYDVDTVMNFELAIKAGIQLRPDFYNIVTIAP